MLFANLSILDFSILQNEISKKKQKPTDTGKLNICGHLLCSEKGKAITLNVKKNIEIVFFDQLSTSTKNF